MKHRNKAGKHSEDAAENKNEHSLAADFHAVRINQEAQFLAGKEALNPQGNDEFEQRIAEDVNLNTNRMVAEAAFFIAEKRGFLPGSEDSDWFQAEIDVEKTLRRI